MSAPEYVLRSYGGGADVAQLVQEIGASDVSFTIAPDTGWTELDGSPLGTAGPFCVVIDRFTTSVEKILCSAINLTTGVVTVFTSSGYSGRGYDGTTAQAHTPGTSGAGVQTCWSASEAFEANKAVVAVLGGTPSNGQVLTWTSGAPAWGAASALSGQPAALMYQTTLQNISSGGAGSQVTNMASSTLKGGVTFASNALTVPTTGVYRVGAQLTWNTSPGISFAATLRLTVQVLVNGSLAFQGEQDQAATGTMTLDGQQAITTSRLVELTSGDTVALGGFQDWSGGDLATYQGLGYTFLDLGLESQ